MWTYVPAQRIAKATAEALPKKKKCLACEGKLLRVAERATYPPYVWTPNGWICSKCNVMFMGVV